jgi:hypothetical protein
MGKIIFQANEIRKKAQVIIFISDKADFNPKLFRIHIINGTINQEDAIIIHNYPPNISVPNLTEQALPT